jgi:hypothetical protein
MAMASTAPAYTLTPRFEHKQTGQPLSGFAVDITIRFQKDGAGFLSDHNYPGDTADGTWPHNNLAELQETLNGELERLYKEHFPGHA